MSGGGQSRASGPGRKGGLVSIGSTEANPGKYGASRLQTAFEWSPLQRLLMLHLGSVSDTPADL